jgi:peptide/nickel transport system permease protein
MNPNSIATQVATPTAPWQSQGLWSLAWHRLIRDRVAVFCWLVMMGYLLVVLCSAAGLLAKGWNEEVAYSYAQPTHFVSATTSQQTLLIQSSQLKKSLDPIKNQQIEAYLSEQITDPIGEVFQQAKSYSDANAQKAQGKANTLWFGADRWGRSVVYKTIHGAQTSLLVGLGAAMLATLIGVALGALAGYFGGWIDALCDWLYSMFNAVPYLLLILSIAAVLDESGVRTMILIFGFTGWTGVYRLIRAETIRQRGREYLRAAEALGVPHWQRIVRHILPNTNHLILVQVSILTVAFIKSEVILSFLGFGVPVSEVSWGSMLNEAQNELLLGYWWQLVAATLAMAGLITAWSIFTDSMRDALDPKLK